MHDPEGMTAAWVIPLRPERWFMDMDMQAESQKLMSGLPVDT